MSKPSAFIVAFLTTLVVVLIPVFRTGFVPTEAQGVGNAMPDYEIEVLSGLQNVDNVKLSCRWHGGGCIADTGRVADGNGLDFSAASLTSNEREVYASIRNTKANSIEVHFRKRTNINLCKAVKAFVNVIPESSMAKFWVGTIFYVHVDAAAGVDFFPPLFVEDSNQAIIGEVAVTEQCSWWKGVHLHQSTVKANPDHYPPLSAHPPILTSVVQPNRDNSSASKGIPRPVVVEVPDPENEGETIFEVDQKPFPCISSSMWLWKISSGTPAVTATDAPTTTCPPTNLKLTSGSALTLEFDSSNDVQFELYKADGSGAFCEADASSCVSDGTAAAAPASNTATFERRSGNEPWASGKYRARGRGCDDDDVCGAWSAWSDTIDHIAPPTGLALKTSLTGPLGMHYTRSDIPNAGVYKFVLYRAADPSNFCDPDACEPVMTVLQPATQGTPGRTMEEVPRHVRLASRAHVLPCTGAGLQDHRPRPGRNFR